MSIGSPDQLGEPEKVVSTVCSSHCGGSCLLKVHVKNGVITRIETDDGEELQLRACLRGRAYRQRVYAPDRLKYPMKRVGARGEGKFERISWDEALDTVASELKRVKEAYGPASIVFFCSGGDLGMLHDSWARMCRLLSMMGGYTQGWGTCSFEGGVFAELATFGTAWVGSTRDDLLNSRLIILWGCNPSSTVGETNTCWYLAQAREAGIKIISVDPRYTDSTAVFAHEWIPIRPGTDAAMLIAMANVIATENLQDQAFLDAHTFGFGAFRDYALGVEDGIPKTPHWAEAITGVPATTIRKLAEEYATVKPAALLAGIAAGRTAYGEQYHRAAITLAAMTGNVGISGGSAAARFYTILPLYAVMGMEIPPNPVEAESPSAKSKLGIRNTYVGGTGATNIHRLTDAIIKGKSGGYPDDYKLLYMHDCNFLNQMMNTNKTIQALNKLEFIVVEEQFMTATARFADIVLPVTTFLERGDVTIGIAAPPFIGCRNKVIEPLHEAKSQLEIGDALAARVGITDYNDKTEEEWLPHIMQYSGVPDYDTFREKAVFRIPLAGPYVSFTEEINDPANHPFPTPSGKIEIYSPQLADMENPHIPPIPKYIATWESVNDPLASKYPLQLITTHLKRRAHSQFDNVPWLRELEPQAITISAVDAQARGIEDGDLVYVFNDRGRMIVPARVTERIMPGVVDLPQGAWYTPDENGIDRGGCANVLTRDEPSPGGAMPTNTALVQVEKCR